MTILPWVLAGDTNPLSGDRPGWAGAGLLGLILAWLLLRHLPEKDRMVAEFVEKKEKLFREVVADYERRLDDQRREFTAALNALAAAIAELKKP